MTTNLRTLAETIVNRRDARPSKNFVHVEVLTENLNVQYVVAVPSNYADHFSNLYGYYTFSPINVVLQYPQAFIVWRHPSVR